jgi:hypothetical protein
VNDLQLLQAFYGPGLLNALNTAIVYVGVLAVMLRLDVPLTLVALALFPLLYLGVNRLSKKVYARSLSVQERLAAISDRTQENLSGIQQVKIYAQEDQEIARFRELSDGFRKEQLSLARVRGAMVSLIGIFTGMGTVLVLFVGGLHVIHGRITLGDFVAFNAYLAQLAWPTIALGWIVNVFQRASGAMSRLDEVMSATPDVAPPRGDPDGIRPVDGDVTLKGLTYADAVSMFTGAGPEYWLLPAVVKHLRPGTILELGTEFAMSTGIMRFMAPTAKITSVDVQDCSSYVKGLNVDFICKPSEDVAETWDTPIDLLFIDTEHTYDQVTKELNGFAKHVTGAIMLHDIISVPDVERAVQDWLKDNADWEYRPYNVHFGMGLLWRKHEAQAQAAPEAR